MLDLWHRGSLFLKSNGLIEMSRQRQARQVYSTLLAKLRLPVKQISSCEPRANASDRRRQIQCISKAFGIRTLVKAPLLDEVQLVGIMHGDGIHDLVKHRLNDP